MISWSKVDAFSVEGIDVWGTQLAYNYIGKGLGSRAFSTSCRR